MHEIHDSHGHVVQNSWVWWGPGQQVEDYKGGKRIDERWRPTGGVVVQVDGISTPGRVYRVDEGAK